MLFDQNRPYQEVMPYYFVESNRVKHYLLVAENDDVVGLSNAVDLDRRLKEKATTVNFGRCHALVIFQ